ncbi:hypothetical protein KDL45_05190 [bacterium]|nr:hypothetical protein [bacterium]MCB9477939.1 hypothetical protein [Deltaproteobacteria bacterium]
MAANFESGAGSPWGSREIFGIDVSSAGLARWGFFGAAAATSFFLRTIFRPHPVQAPALIGLNVPQRGQRSIFSAMVIAPENRRLRNIGHAPPPEANRLRDREPAKLSYLPEESDPFIHDDT